MGFSDQERLNMNSKALMTSVIDANPVAQWYETRNPYALLLKGDKVLTNFEAVPVAGNLATARSNAAANPTIIEDLSAVTDAIRLTAVPGTNNSTFLAYRTYNDTTSQKLDNWIQPQMVPQTTGAASIGYSIILYDGDPNAGGTEVTTTDGTTGSGSAKTVGWYWNYALGMLLLSEDFRSSVSNPYVMGFRYVGTTANDTDTDSTILVADETIAAGDIVRVVKNGEVGLTVGRAVKANAGAINTAEVIGVATSAATAGNGFLVATSGSTGVTFGSTPAATTKGSTVFLSTTSGKATLTPPSSAGQSVVQLGILTGADGSSISPAVALNIDFVIALG